VREVKRIQGKKQPLTAAGLRGLRYKYTRIERSRQNEEWRMQGDISCGCWRLTPAEIALTWQTAPPRMPITPPTISPGTPQPPRQNRRDRLAWWPK
jgi:hypothetical protein